MTTGVEAKVTNPCLLNHQDQVLLSAGGGGCRGGWGSFQAGGQAEGAPSGSFPPGGGLPAAQGAVSGGPRPTLSRYACDASYKCLKFLLKVDRARNRKMSCGDPTSLA